MEIISNYKKIQSAIYNFDYKKYKNIILFIFSLMASSLFFYCVFKICCGLQRKEEISDQSKQTDKKPGLDQETQINENSSNVISKQTNQPLTQADQGIQTENQNKQTKDQETQTLIKLNTLKEEGEFEEFQAIAKNVELEDQEKYKLEIQRIPIKIYAETIENLIAKSEEINPEIQETMDSMLQTIEEENQLSIDLENEKVKFIELQIKANLNSEKNNWQDALTKTFLDNYVIELYGKLFGLSQGISIKDAKRDLDFLYQCLIEKEKVNFGTKHGKKIENNTQIFHVKETRKQYCEKTIKPIIEQIIKNNIENKTEYNYQEIAVEINKFFNGAKEIELNKEQKIQAIQYIELNKLQHIFDSVDFQLEKQEFLITTNSSNEKIQNTKEDNEFIVVIVN